MLAAMTRSHLCAVLVAVIAASSAVARAQSSGDPVAAQALFDAAKRLVNEGKFAEACPKLEESQRLDPAIGTHYALAECYEKAGRLASAWVAYLDVASESAAQSRPDREKFAKARAAAIAQRVSRLTVNVPAGSRAPGLQILRDGKAVREAEWGVPVPVDPGRHVVTATAPGKAPFEAAVVAREDGATLAVDLPPLTDAPNAPVAPAGNAPAPDVSTPGGEERHGLGTQRVLAIAAGAVGLAGVAVGTVFGVEALSKHSATQQECQGNVCSSSGLQDVDSGKSAGNVSTVAFSVGAAALVGGAVLWLTAPSGRSSTGSLRAAPMVARDGAGITIQGGW
jgi:hypothetical protein